MYLFLITIFYNNKNIVIRKYIDAIIVDHRYMLFSLVSRDLTASTLREYLPRTQGRASQALITPVRRTLRR